MTALDLLREARGALSRLPRVLGGYHLDIGSRDKLLRRIDALLDAPQVSHHCPACEARAREEEHGYGVVNRDGQSAAIFGTRTVARYYAEQSDEKDPDRAPHRVVELVARPEGERE